jgi:hypothetical protein
MLGKPPLEDQVNLTIRHWQSMSDQIAILTVARFPILAGAGVDEEDGGKRVIGPFNGLFTADPSGKFYYVEHSGAAIHAGTTDLKDLEERAKSYGAEYMKARPSRETATARSLDSSEATSPLQDAVARFNDALAVALGLLAKWLGIEMVGKAWIPADFSVLDSADIQVLSQDCAAKIISRKVYLELLRQNGYLPNDFDAAANEAALKKEQTDVRPADQQESNRTDSGAGESAGPV